MKLVTITKKIKSDRSYIDELFILVGKNKESLALKRTDSFKIKYIGECLILDRNEHKKHNADGFYTDIRCAERNILKEITVSPNKRTNDMSYCNKTVKVVAENKTHIQVIVNFAGEDCLQILLKSEYDITCKCCCCCKCSN